MAAENMKIVKLKRSEISADPKWNTRVAVDDTSEAGGDSTGFQGLVDAIANEGQRDPVVVRPNKGKGTPYLLTKGFRRFEAIGRIGDKAGIKDPEVLCIIKDQTEAEALEENISENMNREELTVPDTVLAIKRLKDANPTWTETVIGLRVGKVQGYINRCLQVGNGLAATVMDHWRKAPKKLTMREIEAIAKLPKGEQLEAYQNATRPTDAKPGDGSKWVDGAKKRAAIVGKLFGEDVRDNFIAADFDPDVFFAPDRIRRYVPGVKKNATDKQVQKIVDAATEAYAAALESEPEAPAEETAESDGKPKKAKKNGAQVSAN